LNLGRIQDKTDPIIVEATLYKELLTAELARGITRQSAYPAVNAVPRFLSPCAAILRSVRSTIPRALARSSDLRPEGGPRMAQADSLLPPAPMPTETGSTAAASSKLVLISRGLTLVAISALLVFVAMQGSILYQEWFSLRRQNERVLASGVIGYPGVQPIISYARPPSPWYCTEGKSTRLWGGWQDGVGHSWFVTESGDVPIDHISSPMGRDVYRAIDHPIVEFQGGEIWARIPKNALVAGGSLGGIETVYPILVLQKVLVVNDQIRETPFLVLFNPNAATPNESVSVYETQLGGQRVTMGVTGYTHDKAPMLYDRGTLSLWVTDDNSLRAISGPHKGQRLNQVSHPAVIDWSRWSREHPKSRLVVGADRKRDVPSL
jgi:Protein of unknown function (DUF3179)